MKAWQKVGLLLVPLALWALPLTALAVAPLPRLEISAEIRPDGNVIVTEHRRLSDPQGIESVDYLLPPEAQFQVLALADSSGPLQPSTGAEAVRTSVPPSVGHYRLIRQGEVAHVEWGSAGLAAQDVTLRYALQADMIIHADAVEWYWPAVPGGQRGAQRIDAAIVLPAAGEAYLYAYGGQAGGVVAAGNTLRVSAVNLDAGRAFEWRLLMPKAMLPGAAGRSGSGSLAQLRAVEENRLRGQMNAALAAWIGHWLLLLAPLPLGALYLLIGRRHRPDPEPLSLTAAQLTAVPPAVVGWVYNAAWFDYACAQLMYLERQGALHWKLAGDDPRLELDPAAKFSAADQALLRLFWLNEGPKHLSQIQGEWAADLGERRLRRNAWFDAVARAVPAEWIDRPPGMPGWLLTAFYALAGILVVFSGAPLTGWALALAVAPLAAVLTNKRRWLTPLGETYVSRWVMTYHAAVPTSYQHQQYRVPEIAPEYLLAVEVGDAHLERYMGSERYAFVKAIYERLEPPRGQ